MIDVDSEEVHWFDRKMRSYITAVLLGNESEMGEIAAELDAMKDHPAFTVMLLSTFAGMTGYLLSHLSDEESLFDLWAGVSQEIELETLR